MTAWDSLVSQHSPDAWWTGPFEDDITELGIRAAAWGVEENDGGNRADLMLEEWWQARRGRGPVMDRISDARYTVESLRRDLISKLDAHSPVSQDEVDAYNRALETWKQAQVLWENRDGLLDGEHDRPWAERLEGA